MTRVRRSEDNVSGYSDADSILGIGIKLAGPEDSEWLSPSLRPEGIGEKKGTTA